MRKLKPNPIKALAVIFCLVCALSASAYDFAKDGIYYNINGSNVTVTYYNTSYNSYTGTVNIPATVTYNGTTYNVTSIGSSAFKNCTGLKRVVIPSSVKYLMLYAFQNCTGLTNIVIPAVTIYDQAFDGCTNLKTIVCTRKTPPSAGNETTFPSSLYSSSSVTLYVPQGSLSSYQAKACWSNFTNIKEMSCDFVEDAIFYKKLGNNQAEVSFVYRDAQDYSGDVAIPSTVTHNDTTYTVTSVGWNAFNGFNNLLYSVSVPATVNNISNYAFYGCSNLTSVNIPEGVTDINFCAFGCCYSLPSITIPSSVTWIAQNAFVSCDQLTSITCRATTPPICVDSSCFPSSAYSNATLKVPSASLSAYQNTDIWDRFSNIVGQNYDFEANGIYYIITGPNTASVTYKDKNYNSYSGSLTVPSTVTHEGKTYTVTAVGRAAFYKCTALTSVSLPSTIQTLDYGAFYQCTALTSLTIPSGVTTLGEFCFMNCTSLASISLPNGITSIPRQCFTYCGSLQSITIPGSVDEISYYAFYRCTNLQSVTIQNGVKSILYCAFADCYSLETVSIPASVTTIEESVFSSCQAMIAYNVNSGNTHYCSQDGVLYTADMSTLLAYPNMRGTYYQIPAGVDTIGDSAFQDCNNLQYITLNNDLKTIADFAFWGCNQLTDFFIPASVDSVGVCSLAYCTSLRNIEVDQNNQNYKTDDGVLYTMDGKNLIQYPCARPDKHYSALNTTEKVWDRAFRSASCLKSVYLPTSLRIVGWQAFYESSLERLVIDEGLTTIEQNAFAGCFNLKSIHLPSTLTNIDTWAFQSDYDLAEITFAGTTPPTVGVDAFYYIGDDTGNPVTIYVPAGASSAYASHDWNSSGFSFTLSEISPLATGTTFTVDSLNYATTDANLNTKLTGTTNALVDPGIPPKVSYQGNLCTVTMLADHAMFNDTKMIRAEVPFTVENIDSYCFYGCSHIEKMTLHEGLKQINGFAMSHIEELVTVAIPASVDSIACDVFTYDTRLTAINVASDNTKYTSVNGILFSKDKKRLHGFADGIGPLYTIPAGTEVIGHEAFRGASGLTSVEMPRSLRTIESSAFMACTHLEGVDIPEGVTTIDFSAFSGCTAMTSAALPSTLTSLGYLAFNGASNLATLYVRATTPPTCQVKIDPRTHDVYEPFATAQYNNTNLVVPRGCAAAYQQANIWKKFQHISETDFIIDVTRGDVNGDGEVDINDVTMLISRVLGNNEPIIEAAADVNYDGSIDINDVTMLIDCVLGKPWPEPAPIDQWYLWGNFIGSNPWGDIYDNQLLGISVLPLYPKGNFDPQGRGLLTWTGHIPRQYFTITHNHDSYDDIVSEMWVVDVNTGQYCVKDMTNDDPNYSTFLLDDGYYTISLDTRTMTLYIDPFFGSVTTFESITMPGYYNDWSNTANPMTPVNTGNLNVVNHDWWAGNFVIQNDGNPLELKFCKYGDWSYNWGSTDFPYGIGVKYGNNIPATVGTYDVFFNDITGQYYFIKN